MTNSDLFETTPFLEKKLGADFFEKIPQEPGIYRFYDEKGELLYVGKAKNLRRRLFTYKRARPGRTSRKESRLISRINSFDYDILNSEEEAILQENFWIREYRPEYNHANKHPETYYFITVQELQSGLFFGLSMNSSGSLVSGAEKLFGDSAISSMEKPIETNVYGCFKGHRPVRTSLGTLLKLLWMVIYQSPTPLHLPVQLSRNLTPMRFYLPIPDSISYKSELRTLLNQWLLGNSTELLDHLNEKIKRRNKSVFTNYFLDDAIESLANYFQRSLYCYRIMRKLKENESSYLIAQDEFDDLMVRFKSYQETNEI